MITADDIIISGSAAAIKFTSGSDFGGSASGGSGGSGSGSGGGGELGGGMGDPNDPSQPTSFTQWLPIALAVSLVLPPAALHRLVSQCVQSLSQMFNHTATGGTDQAELSAGAWDFMLPLPPTSLVPGIKPPVTVPTPLPKFVQQLLTAAGGASGSDPAIKGMAQAWVHSLQFDFPELINAASWPIMPSAEPLPGSALSALRFISSFAETPEELAAKLVHMQTQLHQVRFLLHLLLPPVCFA